jgi:MFS family permease
MCLHSCRAGTEIIVTGGYPRLIKNKNYFLLISAQSFSIFGREIGVVALPLLVLGLTNSPAQAGLVASIGALPYLIFGLPAGVLVDRWSRKWVMVFSDLLRFLSVLSIPIAYYFNALTLPQFYVVSFLMGTGFVFFGLAEVAALPSLVNREQLTRATSTYTVVDYAGGLVGPTLGGFIISLAKSNVLGSIYAYLVQAGCLLISLTTVALIDKPIQADEVKDDPHPSILKDVQEGLTFIWQHTQLRTIALIATATNLLFGPVTLAIIVRMKDEFGASATEIGLLFSCAAASGLTSALIAPSLKAYIRVGPTMIGCIALWAFALTSLAMSQSMILFGLSWMIVTAVGGIYEITQNTYRFTQIPDSHMGRVISVFRLIAFGARPVTLLLGGLSIGILGVTPTLYILALGMALLTLTSVFSPLGKLSIALGE